MFCDYCFDQFYKVFSPHNKKEKKEKKTKKNKNTESMDRSCKFEGLVSQKLERTRLFM